MKLLGAIFLIIGLGLLSGSYLSYSTTKEFINTATSADGRVIENRYSWSTDNRNNRESGSYYPVIRFSTTEGKLITFQGTLGTDPPAFDVGESVNVLYKPTNPEEAIVNSFFQLWFLTTLLGGMGFLFLLVTILLIYFNLRKKQLQLWLKANGERINTSYIGIEINTNISVNDRHPYLIATQWLNPKTNEVHNFRSENLWFNPEEFIKNKDITVVIDRNNPQRYMMDISFLPKIAK